MAQGEEDSFFSPAFHQIWRRIEILNRWYELAVRPSEEECSPDDLDLLQRETDDCQELARRRDAARKCMNEKHLPYITTQYEDDLIPKQSTIPDAGLGLFYVPRNGEPLRAGETICYYMGHIHDFHSSKLITDKSYLMLVQGDVLVDPQPLLHVKA